MKPQNVRLFIKPGCPWCAQAQEGLRLRGITYTELDVTTDYDAFTEMKRLTHQTKAPCIAVDGHILADFGAHELDVWWVQMGFKNDRAALLSDKVTAGVQELLDRGIEPKMG